MAASNYSNIYSRTDANAARQTHSLSNPNPILQSPTISAANAKWNLSRETKHCCCCYEFSRKSRECVFLFIRPHQTHVSRAIPISTAERRHSAIN